MRARNVAAAAAAIWGALACSEQRTLQGSPTNRVSWQEDVSATFQARCSGCHGGANPAGGYKTTSYLDALGPLDAPLAVAGDPDSPLLKKIDPAGPPDAIHAAVSDVHSLARSWVVDGQLSFFRSQMHEGGILNPHDPHGEFHGDVLRNAGWNLDTCGKCHGADFTGGTSGVSCTQCHAQGPTSCDTCHGQPPATGAHVAHVSGSLGKPLDCSECHVKPANWNDPGHLTTADGKPKTRATVTFSAQSLAAHATPLRTGDPSYDGTSCSNVYCHLGPAQDAKATLPTPAWNGGPTQAACGTCHGAPPAGHEGKYASTLQCSACHPSTAPTPTKLAATHSDGNVQVGDAIQPAAPGCSGCHGTPGQNAGPPRDLSGNTSPTAIGVGAHQAHLAGTHRLSNPIPCSTCHVLPAAWDAPGHLDQPLPAPVTFSGEALTDGASPAWDRTSATCSSTYCHGGGQKLSTDTSAALQAPVWTLGSAQAFCGACHGLPPTTAGHPASTFPSGCVTCHPSTVEANGAIHFDPVTGTTTHINGVIDGP